MQYENSLVNGKKYLTLIDMDKAQPNEAAFAVPSRLVLVEKSGKTKAFASTWTNVKDLSKMEDFLRQLKQLFKERNLLGYEEIEKAVRFSANTIDGYKKLLDSIRNTDFKARAFVIVSDEKSGTLKILNVPLDDKTLAKIARDNSWDIFLNKRNAALKLEKPGSPHQNKGISFLSAKVKKNKEPDMDSSYFYFRVPGSDTRVLGSISLLEYYRNMYKNFDFKEVSIGPAKLLSSHSQGLQKPVHNFTDRLPERTKGGQT